MNSMAFSLLANSSTEVDENQEMELTIGSLSILIGPSGSSRLSDPMKQDPSASEPKTVAMMEYSEGFSSEVNSPVSLEEVQKGKNHRRQRSNGKFRRRGPTRRSYDLPRRYLRQVNRYMEDRIRAF
jgi:hypothetical protein